MTSIQAPQPPQPPEPPEAPEAPEAPQARRSLLRRVFASAPVQRLDTIGWGCVAILAGLVLLALLGPVIVPHDPYTHEVTNRLSSPDRVHWLGTDHFGRDVFARLTLGLRTTLVVAAASTSLGLLIGTLAGAGSAYLGGKIDTVFAGVLDVLLVFPSLLFGMMLMVALGPGAVQLVIAATIVLATRFARVARAQAHSLKAREFIEAARASGKSRWRIVWSDLLPNVLPHNLGLATYWFDRAVNMEAGLSFLGIGISPPQASVGVGLREGLDRLFVAPHLVAIYAGLVVLLIVSLSLLADRLMARER